MRGEASHDRGDERRIESHQLQLPNCQDFKGKEGCCEWRLKEPRKTGCHPGHEKDTRSIWNLDMTGKTMRKGRSDLDRYTFPTDRTTKEMAHPGRQHDQRHQDQGDFLLTRVSDIKDEAHPF